MAPKNSENVGNQNIEYPDDIVFSNFIYIISVFCLRVILILRPYAKIFAPPISISEKKYNIASVVLRFWWGMVVYVERGEDFMLVIWLTLVDLLIPIDYSDFFMIHICLIPLLEYVVLQYMCMIRVHIFVIKRDGYFVKCDSMYSISSIWRKCLVPHLPFLCTVH